MSESILQRFRHKEGAAKLSALVCAYNPAVPGLSPKHTINAYIIYSQICDIFFVWKERK